MLDPTDFEDVNDVARELARLFLKRYKVAELKAENERLNKFYNFYKAIAKWKAQHEKKDMICCSETCPCWDIGDILTDYEWELAAKLKGE